MLKLIPESLSIGITLEEFWSMDLQEIRLVFTGYQTKMDRQHKDTLLYIYQLATQISSFVSCGLAGKQPPTIEEVYPNLFNVPEVDKAKQFENEMLVYVDLYNQQRKKQQGEIKE